MSILKSTYAYGAPLAFGSTVSDYIGLPSSPNLSIFQEYSVYFLQ